MFRSRRASLILVIALAVLAMGPVARAGQPVTQTLNPPPPAFETCKAVGNGTICAGERTVPLDDDTGAMCSEGQTAFDIMIGGTLDQLASRTYDVNGNMTRRFIQDTYRSGRFVNSVTGASVPFTGHDTVTDILAGERQVGSGPDNFSLAKKSSGSPIDIAFPTDGAVIVPGPVGILKASKRINAARLFTNFMYSKEYSQALVSTSNYPLRSDVAPAPGVPTIDKVKYIRNTVDQLTKDLPDAIAKWRDIMGV